MEGQEGKVSFNLTKLDNNPHTKKLPPAETEGSLRLLRP